MVPVCLRVILKSLHDDGTTIEDTLYCIASEPSISVAQSVTTAVPLLVSMADPAGALVMLPAVAAGAGVIVTGASAGVVVADGAGADVGDDELSLQAASASAQATASRLGLMFIDRPPGWQSRIIEQRCSASREDTPPSMPQGRAAPALECCRIISPRTPRVHPWAGWQRTTPMARRWRAWPRLDVVDLPGELEMTTE